MVPLMTDRATVTSFPLERPAIRVRRRDTIGSAGSLPYFIAGEENRLVTFVSQAKTAIFDLGNPVLLVGPSGSGKTAIAMHLAAKQAVAQSIDDQPAAVLYYPAIDFSRQYAEAIAADDLPPLRQQIHEAPILIVDDLHLISDKAAAQDELALRIDGRTQQGLATILTCRRLPTEIRGMRPTLISRVLPGLTVPIATPEGESRFQLLRELALHLELEMDDDLLETLHRGLDSRLPVRSLEAAMKQISLCCRMNDTPPTLEAVQSAIQIVGKNEEVSIAAIAGAVAHYFRMKLSDLRSSSRKQKLVRARSLSMLLARRLTSKSMHQIGGYFGGRDHTTVLHAIRKTESRLEQDADLRRAADEVNEILSAA
jgi:chromosomal replication initiator protein